MVGYHEIKHLHELAQFARSWSFGPLAHGSTSAFSEKTALQEHKENKQGSRSHKMPLAVYPVYCVDQGYTIARAKRLCGRCVPRLLRGPEVHPSSCETLGICRTAGQIPAATRSALAIPLPEHNSIKHIRTMGTPLTAPDRPCRGGA